MKVIMFFLLAFSATLQAQTLFVSTGIEKTVTATESQFMMGYQSKKQWRIGSFYQNTITPLLSEGTLSTSRWYGVFSTLTLARSEKIVFYALLRAGIKDDQFVIVVPSLETNVRITKWFSVAVASSYRQGYSAFSIKTQFSLFNNSRL